MSTKTNTAKRAWLLTETLKNWEIAEEKAVFGCHGNRSFLKDIKKGDSFVAYVPEIGFIGNGTITSEYYVSPVNIWPDKRSNHRFRLSNPFISGRVLPAAAIVDDLSFVRDKKSYRAYFKSGIREIPTDDFEIIVERLKGSANVLGSITEKVVRGQTTTEIGAELHDRVANLFKELGFSIIDNNYSSAGPDITVVDPKDRENSKIIIQCKNSREEKKTFRQLDKHLNEYAGRLKTSGAKAALIVIAGQMLPKKIPGETGELDFDKVLEKYSVAIWTTETLKYYEGLLDKISHFARYQVLSDLGIKLAFDNDLNVNAVKINQNRYIMYAAALPADWLLQAVSVVRRVRYADKTRGYQRLLEKSRINPDREGSISNYISTDEQWFFPNALVLASSSESKLNYANGKLSLESKYGMFWAIDGQHRLFAFANVDNKSRKKDLLCVLIDSQSLGSEQEQESELAQIFVNLNGEARRVPKALLYELYELLGSKDNPALEIILKLTEEKFFEGSIRGYSDKEGTINLVAFADAKGTKSLFNGFHNKFENKDTEEIIDITKKYILDSFKELAEIFKTEWNDPDTYFLKTDRGVKGILELLYKIFSKYGSDNLYVTKVFKALKQSEFDFSSQTAKGLYLGAAGPDRLATSFSKHINKIIHDFAPEASSRHSLVQGYFSRRGEIPDAFLKEWLGKLEGDVRCSMMYIDESTPKYLSYLDPRKISRVRMFFGNHKGNEKKVKNAINQLREKNLDITLTQSQKRTDYKGSFFHERWIGDDKIQIRTEVDLKDDSLNGATFHMNVDGWENPPELDSFDRFWQAAEINKDVEFGYDWVNSEG